MNGEMANLLLLITLVNCLAYGFAWSKEGGVAGDSNTGASGKGQESGEADELKRLRKEIVQIDESISIFREAIKSSPSIAPVVQSQIDKFEKKRAALLKTLVNAEILTLVRTATFYKDLVWVGEKTTLYHSRRKVRPYSGWVRAVYRTGDPEQTEATIRKLSYYEKGRPQTTIVWKPNGERCSVTTLRSGNGVENHWHTNGRKRERSIYRDGLANGESILWYPSGKLEEKGNYKDGNLHGLVLHYEESGKILGKATWKDGEPVDGTVVRWKGQMGKARYSYENGKKDGDWIAWDSEGRRRATGSYEKGQRSGLWITFDEKGKEVSSRSFPKTKP